MGPVDGIDIPAGSALARLFPVFLADEAVTRVARSDPLADEALDRLVRHRDECPIGLGLDVQLTAEVLE